MSDETQDAPEAQELPSVTVAFNPQTMQVKLFADHRLWNGNADMLAGVLGMAYEAAKRDATLNYVALKQQQAAEQAQAQAIADGLRNGRHR